jgi:endonuclease YncB( thermonuclease family)
MSRGSILAVVAASFAAGTVASGASSSPQPLTQHGTVISLADPGALVVRIADGTSERVQLVGITLPSAGSCASAQAAADLGTLVTGKPVWLLVVVGKGRLVGAYVILPGGIDAGLELVQRGDATVSDAQPFKQRAAYLRAQKIAQAGSLGLWGCNAPSGPDQQGHGHGPQGHGPDSNGGPKDK